MTKTILPLVTAALILPGSAQAYTIANVLADGCHEAITASALRQVRGQLATAAPLPPNDDEQALIDDLQFSPDGDMKDLGGATLLVAVRDNDLKGRGSSDLSQLAEVHGDPTAQQEHCLRRAEDKEPGGSAASTEACRAFIRQRALEALDGLDASGRPDPNDRTTLLVHLSIRGQVDAPLPTYYVRMGQAIHAIEDSFAGHTYRTPDQTKITVVLDWLDFASGTLDESRDGPAHIAELDRCDDTDDLKRQRHAMAIEAASALLSATLDPAKSKDAKIAAVDGVLDRYMTFSPGCTFANQWCNAAENQYKNASGCSCRAEAREPSAEAMLLVAALALLAARRRTRPKIAALSAGLFAASLVSPARADDEDAGAPPPPAEETAKKAQEKAEEHAPPPPTVVPVKEPLPRDPTVTAWGGYLGVSGSIEKPAIAGTIAGRVRVSKHWTLGLDAEWNPWLALNGTPVRAGVLNGYGTVMLRFPLAYESFNLRTTVNAGASYLLTSFYGAPSGSIGIYGGLTPLGLEWKLSKVFYMIISPIGISLPIPHLTGVPFVYPQYRTSLGLEFYAN